MHRIVRLCCSNYLNGISNLIGKKNQNLIIFGLQNMPNTYFTADLHLGHDNIRKYCHRPFASVTEMDSKILNNLNETVKPDDYLYILGDFAFRSAHSIMHYRSRIVCQNVVLILGNHDPYQKKGFLRVPDPILYQAFSVVDKAMTIVCFHNGLKYYVYLHHYACRTWDRSFHGSFHLYGHSHGQLPDDPNAYSMDVGVDAHNFFPISFADVVKHMTKKTRVLSTQQELENKESVK